MKGNPLLRTLCFLAVWLCLFPLVYQLTNTSADIPPAASTTQPSDTRPTWIRLRFAHVPSAVLITSGGTELVRLPSPIELESEVQIDLPVSGSSAQLELSVDWEPRDAETVVELRLEPDGLSPRVFHFWAAKQCRERVRVTW